MKIRVGSRGSVLALAQTKSVISALAAAHPELEFQLVIVKSTGDAVQDVPLNRLGGSGVFTRELEQKLLQGEIDLAVHSLKDLPSVQPEGLVLASPPRREDYRDALVLRADLAERGELPVGARLGTGSPRRALQLKKLRDDLQPVGIRGNIETRLAQLGDRLEGVVLAAAALKRLGLQDQISACFKAELFVPAPAQGALGLELRAEDTALRQALTCLYHRQTDLTVRAERAFLRETGAGCHAPVGAFCTLEGEELTLTALYGQEHSALIVKGSAQGAAEEPEALGIALAERLKTRYDREVASGAYTK